MKQGIIYGVIMTLLIFFGVNQLAQSIVNSGSEQIVLMQNGEEIYSSPFLKAGQEQYIWYIHNDNEKIVLKDQEIIDYYGLESEVSELDQLSNSDKDKVVAKTDNNTEINMIANKDGAVYMYEANCPDKIGIKMDKITDSSKVITCAPHKLVVKITGVKGSDNLDA